MKFTKMQGLGNDYVYVNGFVEHVDDPRRLARTISDRHTGIGADGLILIQPSTCAPVRMEMYNIFNRVQFGVPARTILSGTPLGRIVDERNPSGYVNSGRAGNSARQGQLALRLVF